MTQTYDFAVIGRGMMGTACARWLAEAGHSVVLIGPDEPRDRAANRGPFASHHDAGRITRRVSHDARWSAWSSASIDRYWELENTTGIDFFHEVGALMAGHRKGTMAPFVDGFLGVAKTLTDEPEMLDADAVRQRFGYDLPAGSTASFERTRGGWINPRLYRTALENRALGAGATVVHEAASSIADGVVSTGTDQIHAGQIVVATGGYAATDGLLPARPKMRVYARTIAFAEVAGPLNLPTMIWVPEGIDDDLYMLPPIRYPDGKWYLKVGGEQDSPQLTTNAEMTDWFQSAGRLEAGDMLLGELRRVLPDVPWVRTHTEACAVTFTQTGYPYIDRVDARLTVLTGGNGAGAKCCDELGRMGAEVALGRATPDLGAVWA
jgi:sarcosine oxidase